MSATTQKRESFDLKPVEIIMGKGPSDTHVVIDGRDIPCTRVEVTLDANDSEFVRVILEIPGPALKEPLVVKGTLHLDPPEDHDTER